jgi:hypothetical protein
MFSASAPMADYPKIYNIEMDPHEDLIVAAMFGWVLGAEAGETGNGRRGCRLRRYPPNFRTST